MPRVTPLMVENKTDTMKKASATDSPPSQVKEVEGSSSSAAPVAFATPDRVDTVASKAKSSDAEVLTASEVDAKTTSAEVTTSSIGKVNTVTPLEAREDKPKTTSTTVPASEGSSNPSSATASPLAAETPAADRKVRFGGDGEEGKGDVGKDDENDVAADGEEVASPLGDSPASSTSSKRGLVSRRGGRYASPTRAVLATSSAKDSNDASSGGAVLEYKTFRSPANKSRTDSAGAGGVENDTVPSLCSANSGGLQSTASPDKAANQPLSGSKSIKGGVEAVASADEPAAETKEKTEVDQGGGEAQTAPQSASTATDGKGTTVQKGKPFSITCDPSMINSTSPLAANDVDSSPSAAARARRMGGAPPNTVTTPSKSARPTGERGEGDSNNGRRNVTFSPTKKTPTRSPPGSQFQSLPSLQDAKLNSPCGIFLSPYSPSPSAYQTITEVPSFDKASMGQNKPTEEGAGDAGAAVQATAEEKSSKARDQERERAVSTPTDFALDFGKGHQMSASFDASNVLAWLQSPTAHGLFSPGGGLGPSANTPRGYYGVPRTPRTPTVSTSFFFSDVASLPRNGDFSSPKPAGAPEAGGQKRGGAGAQQGSYSSMICISPLASKRNAQGGGGNSDQQRGAESQADTPMNYKDVFASPRLPSARGGEAAGVRPGQPSPSKSARSKRSGSSGDPNLDAVHMAERDLMEDEDLSVLLQLASHSNTPGGGGNSGPHVFRGSPRSRRTAQPDPRQSGYGNTSSASGGSLPALQLPIIGGREGGGTASKLARKTAFRDHADANDFTPPPLSIRSSTSSGSKEIYLGGSKSRAGEEGAGKEGDSKTEKGASTSKSSNAAVPKSDGGAGKRKANPKANAKSTGTKKTTKKGTAAGSKTTYGSHPQYAHPGGPTDPSVPYYPMPGTMPPGMPPGGSMRVVVGGPPPSSPGQKSPHRPPPYPVQPPPGAYPRHPYTHHPPPPHMGAMGVPPPFHSHYPPHPHGPRPMPMFASQHPQATTKTTAKKGKQTKAQKASAKRPASAVAQGKGSTPGAKKARKSPSKSGGKRKAKSSVTGTGSNPVDRQKVSATIAAVNAASGGRNDKAAALAAAILRGVTMRPSGKWQAQLYYAGKSRYIGVFDTREKAALAYEIAREKLKADNKSPSDQSAQSLKATEAAVNSARKAAFDGVNEKDPRLK